MAPKSQVGAQSLRQQFRPANHNGMFQSDWQTIFTAELHAILLWPNIITNEELLRGTETESITTQVQQRRWRWIGHVLRQQTADLSRVDLRWTPDGRRKRGRPKETWRRTVEREMKGKGWTWGHLEARAGFSRSTSVADSG
ncbi:hypothetical protein C0Q70_20284 [Pomacea canaliculata]|uniref:Uncharacterized protein n=1 Tax=Pomacea canaliculata TaxID=400727 RepID=A0A2T7NF38_POMCA|nr:hypothetical protein C0Q70_20284 [Pomacea canaliculata]